MGKRRLEPEPPAPPGVVRQIDATRRQRALLSNTHDGDIDKMDILHTQLLLPIERQLAWVQTEPIDWKFLVQCFTWTVTGWELYLL